MKVKQVWISISLATFCLFSSIGIAGTYGGGSGDSGQPFEIWDADDFIQIGMHPEDWDKHFILCSDIDLEGITDYNRIGTGYSDTYFSGVFDGNDFSISNWSYETSESIDYIGLFGTVRGTNAQIKNLTLIAPSINAINAGEVAPLVGYLIQGKITNCHVKGGSVKGLWLVGGLVGQNDYFSAGRGGIIENSSSTCRVEGVYTSQTFAGGLVGLNNGKISQCFAIGNVSGFVYVGGLVGKNQKSIIPSESGNIDNSYALGNIAGNNTVGGLIGSNAYGEVSYCYSAGKVEAISNKGGLVGEFLNALGGSFSNCFWDFENSGLLVSAAGTGLSTNNLMSETTYTSQGWDFTVPVWTIYETNSYPYLAWQNVATGKYGGGSGSAADPYRIFHGRHLDKIGQSSNDWNKTFCLMKNIDLSAYTGSNYHIIGNSQTPFTGVFCGGLKQVSNLIYQGNSSNSNAGLFGFIKGENAEIYDLKLYNINFSMNDTTYGGYIGLLAGRLEDGKISNCEISGGIIAGKRYIGGLVGSNTGTISNCRLNINTSGSANPNGGLASFSSGKIVDCHTSGHVSDGAYKAGLVAHNSGEILRCSSACEVSTFSGGATGGLVGFNEKNILESYSEGSAHGTPKAGGLVGTNYGMVKNCYSKCSADTGGLIGINGGIVETSFSVGQVTSGGLIGSVASGHTYSVINCYWDINTSGQTASAGGTGLTTSQMKTMGSFVGFASEGAWTIQEGVDYPHLAWENVPGDVIYAVWYAGGTGTAENPYLIQTAQQFNIIGMIPSEWNKSFKQIGDINLSGYTQASLNLIGKTNAPFSGIYDGDEYGINNFRYVATTMDAPEFGIFRRIDHATIKNVRMVNAYVDYPTTKYNKGILVGEMVESTISNCRVINGYIRAAYGAALLVGENEDGQINDCVAEGTVVSTNSGFTDYYGIGGLIAYNSGEINRCYSTGSVTGYYWFAGGLVGQNYGTIENSYSSANVQDGYAGGLVGANYGNILNCYSYGIPSQVNGGGLVAVAGTNAFTLNSFWDTTVSGIITSSGGIGLTTTEMKNSNTYLAWGGTNWKITNHTDYPRLFWEDSIGSIIQKLPYAAGDGSSSNPYQIANAQQLYYLSMYYDDWEKHIELTNDIDYSDISNPNGCLFGYKQLPFTGIFNGNGFSIIHFNLSNANETNVGLFRYVTGEESLISNIRIINPNLTLNNCSYVGTLVGTLEQGMINNCHIQGGVVTQTVNTGPVGGLVGTNSSKGVIRNSSSSAFLNVIGGGGLVSSNIGIIENCYSTCDITATDVVGGLVAGNSGQINNCYFIGNITSTGSYVGGLAGRNYSGIRNCYAQGHVSGNQYVGGLVGYCDNSTNTLLYHCYSACQVTGNLYVGAVEGRKNSSIVNRCYWDTDICDIQLDEGAIGLTTSQMHQASSFEGWGCDPVWEIDEGNDYPRLAWEGFSRQPVTTEAYGGGCGTEDEPFAIASVEDLNEIGLNEGDWGGKFELLSDLEMSILPPEEYNIIGDSSVPFTGIFEGNGHEIRNLNIVSDNQAVGLFGRTGAGSEIRNIKFIDPNIISSLSTYTGTLAGVSGSIVDNCIVQNGIVAGNTSVGGLVGYNTNSLTNSFSMCTVEGSERVGGLVGTNSSAIEKCFSSSIVNGTSYVGGLVGYGNYYGSIQDSYAQAEVNGQYYVGGLAGYIIESNITSCYALGQVTGDSYVGGLIGDIINQTVVDKCYAIVDVNGVSRVGGLIGYMFEESTIRDSYSKSNVNGEQYIGGLIGYAYDPYDSWHRIRDCYSNSDVQGNMDIGGFIGYANSLYFNNCYSSSSIHGNSNVGGFAGSVSGDWFFDCFWDSSMNPGLGDAGNNYDLGNEVTAHNTGTMHLASTYLVSGWDFVEENTNGINDIWRICDGTNYPRLSWEETLVGDFRCPDGVALEDYSYLSQFWLQNCNDSNNYCEGADLDGMGSVDLEDMLMFCENWLAGTALSK